MYLLDSHTSTSSKALPILDIKSYKHVVYIFDAMFYSITNWPRNTSAPGSSGLKTGAGEINSLLLLWGGGIHYF